jgi:uncharacterized membrane protein SirB2
VPGSRATGSPSLPDVRQIQAAGAVSARVWAASGCARVTLYGFVKYLHVSCVALSGAGFLLRGLWALTSNPRLQHRVTRRLPHVVDTVLLLSAVILAGMIGQYPFIHSWVTAKVLGLILYIVLGAIALRYGPTLTVRLGALLAALATYAWIISVAILKNPWGFFAV